VVAVDLDTGDALFGTRRPGRVDDGWAVASFRAEGLGDSDKSWTVPAGQVWRPLLVGVQLTSSADPGDRQIEVCIEQPDAGFAPVAVLARAGVQQPANVMYRYLFAPGVADLTSVRDSVFVSTPIPETWLKAGDVLRVWDNAARAPAADHLMVFVSYLMRGET